jgi:hypothetical protein
MTQETTPTPSQTEAPLWAHVQDKYGKLSLQAPDARLGMYIREPATAEITDFELVDGENALLHGQLLLSSIERHAREIGVKWLIVTSGPDNTRQSTEFWNAVFGKSIAMQDDYDGANYGRQIWLKELAEND